MIYIMIGLFVLYIILVTVVYNSNEHFITIRYFDNNNENFQMATEIISQDANCIKFKNEFGMIQTICAENISVTEYK
jgi:Tfp pilus assembly protein PilW